MKATRTATILRHRDNSTEYVHKQTEFGLLSRGFIEEFPAGSANLVLTLSAQAYLDGRRRKAT